MSPVPVCQTVTGAHTAELVARRDNATDADLVEIRLDGAAPADPVAVLTERRVPAIVTCRPRREGGGYDGPEADRLALLRAAGEHGAEYLDIEWDADRQQLAGCQSQIVLSHHDFTGTAADLAARIDAMARAPHDVIKVATRADRLADCVRLRVATAALGRRVVIAMGEAGVVTRLCPWLFGSEWTYAGTAAPGQMPVSALIRDFRIRETTRATRVFGTTGDWRAAVTLATAHNAAFRALAIDAVSVPLTTEAGLRDAARALGILAIASVPALDRDVAARAARDVDRWAHTEVSEL